MHSFAPDKVVNFMPFPFGGLAHVLNLKLTVHLCGFSPVCLRI